MCEFTYIQIEKDYILGNKWRVILSTILKNGQQDAYTQKGLIRSVYDARIWYYFAPFFC